MADVFLRFRGRDDGATATAREVRAAVEQTGLTAKEAALKQVQASIQKQEKLKQEIVAYREVASAAKRGSSEQVAASDLAKRAEKELAASIGTTRRSLREMGVTASHASSEVSRVSRGALAGSGIFRGMGRQIAFASSAFIGTFGLVHGIKTSIDAGADLEKQLARTNLVFGTSAKVIIGWSKDTVRSLGLSDAEALKFADSIGLMLTNLGVAPAKAAALSKSLAQLAVDIAAVRGTDPEQALSAITAALAGRTRALKLYGIQIDATAIKEEALRLGLVKATGDVTKITLAQDGLAIARAKEAKALADYGRGTTNYVAAHDAVIKAQLAVNKAVEGAVPGLNNQQRALATVSLVEAAAAKQHGYFGAHTELLSEKTKILHAALQNLEANIGGALTPAVSAITTKVTDWISKSENQAKVTHAVEGAVSKLTAAAKIIGPIIGDIATASDKVAKAMGGWNNAIKIFLGFAVAAKVLRWNSALVGSGGLLSSLRLVGKNWKINLTLIGAAAITAVLIELQKRLNALGPTTFQPDQSLGVVDLGKGVGYDQTSGRYLNVGKGSAPGLAPLFTEQQAAEKLGLTVDQVRAKIAALKKEAAAGTTAAGLVPPPGGFVTTGSGVQLPTSQRATHQTAGLPGFPAVDIMAQPGTPIRAPEDGMITRISGNEPTAPPPQGQGGPWGLSIYFVGSQTGNTYYMTHLMKVAQPGSYSKGDVIGVIGDYPGSSADHVHFAIHQGSSPEASYPSTLINPADYLSRPRTGTPGAPGIRTTAAATHPAGYAQAAAVGQEELDTLKGIPATFKVVLRNEFGKAIGTETVAEIKASIAKWMKALHDATTPAEIAKALAGLEKVRPLVQEAFSSADTAGLVVGTKKKKAALAKLVTPQLATRLDTARQEVSQARDKSDFEQTKALEDEIAALGAVKAALVKLKIGAGPKKLAEIAKALSPIESDLATARDALKKINDEGLKTLAEARAHLATVGAIVKLKTDLGQRVTAADYRRIFALPEDAAKKLETSLKASVKKMGIDLKAALDDAHAELASLAGLPDEITVELHDKFGRVIGVETIAEVRKQIGKLLAVLADPAASAKLKQAAAKTISGLEDAVREAVSNAAQGVTNTSGELLSALNGIADDVSVELPDRFGRVATLTVAELRQMIAKWAAVLADPAASAKLKQAAAQALAGLVPAVTEAVNAASAAAQAAQQAAQDAAVAAAQGVVDAMQSEVDAAQGVVNKAQQAADLARSRFESDLNRAFDLGLQVFDARTQEMLDTLKAHVEVSVNGILEQFTIGEGDLTPAEQALQDLQQKSQQADLQHNLLMAQAQADPGAIAAARLAIQEDALQAQATAERKAADDALAQQKKDLSQQRAVLRDNLELERQDILDAFDQGKIDAKTAQSKILALLNRYGVDYAAAGRLLGAMFEGELHDAFDRTTKDAQIYTAALAQLADATGALNNALAALAASIKALDGLRADTYTYHHTVEVTGENTGGERGSTSGRAPGVASGIITGPSGNRYTLPTAGGEILSVPTVPGVAFQHGGKVPGQYVGKEDTVLARLTPGEMVIDRSLTKALEKIITTSGGGRMGAAPTSERAFAAGGLVLRGAVLRPGGRIDRDPHFQIGGKLLPAGIMPGFRTGRDSETVRVAPGELILNEAQQGVIASKLRQGGLNVNVVISNPVLLGRHREIADEIGRLAEPAIRRRLISMVEM